MTTAHDLPVVEDWYVATPVDERITLIEEPHVDLLLQANIWHIAGVRRDLFVDAGLGVASLKKALPRYFGNDPAVVVTHTHLDHVGSAHEFEECWAHESEDLGRPGAATLSGPSLAAALNITYTPIPDLLITAKPAVAYDPASFTTRPARVTRQLRHGDEIDLGDRVLTVLHMPGHTPGSICLYDRDSRILFTGDVLYDGELLDTLFESDISDYRESLRTMKELDVDVVHPGHGPSFDGSRMRELIDTYLKSGD